MVQWLKNPPCNAAAAKSLQSCLALCDPIDGSPPGSSVHGILQARVLEWGAIAFSVALQETPVRSLIWENPTGLRTIKSVAGGD